MAQMKPNISFEKKKPPSRPPIRPLPKSKSPRSIKQDSRHIPSPYLKEQYKHVHNQIRELSETADVYQNKFKTGFPFVCHYKWYSPAPQLIWTSDDLSILYWGSQKLIKKANSVRTHSIIRIEEAKSENFSNNIDLDLCFSVILPSRKSLHLQSMKIEDKLFWFSAFDWLSSQQKVSVPFNFKHKTHVDCEYKWVTKDLSDFLLIEKVGEGHFGKVFRGVHRATKIEMAVKSIRVKDQKEIQEIANEVDILKTCRHNNIVSYFGWTGPDPDGHVWILMDFCQLGSVMDIRKKDEYEYNEDQIASIVIQVLKGLEYLHSLDIYHQDIKGRNILMKNPACVTLADFGLSTRKLPSGKDNKWAPCGTPYFMAPEVISGRCQNSKSDIWSLGMTIIEIIEGKPPFQGLKLPQLARAIVEGPAPKLKSEEFSTDLNHFISTCFTKDPILRPSASSLLNHPFLYQKNSNIPLTSPNSASLAEMVKRLVK